MNYTLKNDVLTVEISDLGAQILSVKRGNCEYIWQRDEKYWANCAPIMFPVCGRIFGSTYTYAGKEYHMENHGFARLSVFDAKQDGDCKITFTLTDSEETLKQYPFNFRLEITYKLDSDTLSSEITVKNTGKDILPFAPGAHPGFCVPLDGKGEFSDYYIEFEEGVSPDHMIFTDTCFQTGHKKALKLEKGYRLPLHHDMFDNDAIFMSKAGNKASLKSDKTDRFVTYNYQGFPYLGLWHKPKSDAPYVCIEPWYGLPSYDGALDDFATRSDMFRLEPNGVKTVGYSIIFG